MKSIAVCEIHALQTPPLDGGQDQRVVKRVGGASTRYVYSGQNTLLAEQGPSGWKSYIWLGGTPLAQVNGSTVYWLHDDHLGRPMVASNAAQQTVWKAEAWPYHSAASLDLIGGVRLGYPGQTWDAEANTWHNGMRDYDPQSGGRYLQSDPIGLAGGVNTYTYVSGNPVNFIDPLGLKHHSACETDQKLANARVSTLGLPKVAELQ